MQSKEIICTACPIGCRLTIYRDEASENGFQVEGSTCKRGISYAIAEITDPRRILTSTVRVINSTYKRLPVRTGEAIPKDKIFQCMDEINRIEIKCPVKMGDVLIENIAETGINLISSRNL
ncbi:MAG: DUF1667 domain-containing protein [Candidatus Marinimicrobia bacterium]|nr:DUF1667 domain-containing protein [Candidatus Neomarinimicrobiota bacterium]